MMTLEVWKLPTVCAGIDQDPDLLVLPGRNGELRFVWETDDGGMLMSSLKFKSMVAHRCTYLPALTIKMLEAYCKLVDMQDSDWLQEAQTLSNKFHHQTGKEPPMLHHFAICFDDGPYFEVICEGFEEVEPVSI